MAYKAMNQRSLMASETYLITLLVRKRHPTQHNVKTGVFRSDKFGYSSQSRP